MLPVISLSDTHMTERPLRYTNMHTLLQKMNTVPFPVFPGMWYSTCRGSSRRSAWSSFCINHSDCCCLTVRLTACNSTSASGYGVWGRRSQPESLHRLFILCTQPYIPSPLLRMSSSCGAADDWQSRQPHSSCTPCTWNSRFLLSHVYASSQCLSSSPLLSHPPPLLLLSAGSLPSLSLSRLYLNLPPFLAL